MVQLTLFDDPDLEAADGAAAAFISNGCDTVISERTCDFDSPVMPRGPLAVPGSDLQTCRPTLVNAGVWVGGRAADMSFLVSPLRVTPQPRSVSSRSY